MADETDYEHESAPSTDGTYAEHTQNISDNEKLILWFNGVTQDEDTEQGSYSCQWDIPSEAIPYMGFSPEMIENFGLIISSNGRQRVQVHQIEDYYILPVYPHTHSTGIATFVHVAKPLLPDNPTPQEISAAFTKIKTQIEFSLANGNGNGRYNITSLKFLHGIRVCGHAHPKVTSYTEEYNCVDVSKIRNIVRELPKPTLSSIQQMLKEATENPHVSTSKSSGKRKRTFMEPPALDDDEQETPSRQRVSRKRGGRGGRGGRGSRSTTRNSA
ncbi:uncharacterized protein BCR38DRAFT_412871 [Pseudomassariella vexata]|uniref:Uncharacterized protein n=1 Tax=Pseudomassariella vexata TaxID=1141098 RepID=A0A1Y2DIV6_9PEZI|nr:uncharacterized protein BCR38DRAFT_412871 [Pseudomassariella vexata]ORY59161.1 hypothetical protein BCR38DRAFT_412871 [Pseudomassariella vexata]